MFKKLFKSEQKKPNRRRDRTKPKDGRTQRTRKQHVKMDVADLRVGMLVVELDKPWEESGFMFQSLELKSASDIQAVQKECAHVWVDYDEFTIKKVGSRDQGVTVEEEFEVAKEVHSLASETVSTLFEEIRLGAEVDGTKVKQAVNGCVDSILRNPDASGMLHDVGKTGISSEVLSKAGPLSDEEHQEMQKHTRYGRDILLSTKSVMSGAADVAHSHHEREDGTGYPRKLPSESIPVFAKVVAIAEAYDTITTKQTYRAARSPSEALQELYALRGKQFDEDMVIKFIDAVGIFPPGSIVELLNGEIGIVLANTTDKLRPRVIVILDAAKEPVRQKIVDLSQMETDSEGNVYQVKTTLSDGSFGIDVADFQRAGLRLG